MLRLSDRPLSQTEQNIIDVIDGLQALVDAEIGFSAKAAKSKSLWETKGNAEGKRAFEQIKLALTEMCVGVNVCNYCEGNEANDIEHIYPKSFFPEFAFVWTNYLLACKQCNSGLKLDKCFVMDDEGNVHETTRGQEPLHRSIAQVNPRIEDPDDFFWLNMKVWKFEIHEGLSEQNFNKADKTLEILALNERDFLLAGRHAAAQEYFNKMDRLRRIVISTSVQEVEQALNPYEVELVDRNLLLDVIKMDMKNSIRRYIQKLPHPSVWNAIKAIESRVNERWQDIFQTIPEALEW
ncbi:MAG: hypothetical protein ACKVT2_10095 [Saprospiraceae bacterium]